MASVKEKVRVNVYIDKTVIEDAKRLSINLSNSLETALKSELETKWLERNQHKIEIYNQSIAVDGLPFNEDDLCI